MAKPPRTSVGKGAGPPDATTRRAFEIWLAKRPREWSVTIAARAALRVLPLEDATTILPLFRAAAIARVAAKYPHRAIAFASAGLMPIAASPAASAAIYAAFSADQQYAAETGYAEAASAAVHAAATAASAINAAVMNDATRLHAGVLTAEQLTHDPLWQSSVPAELTEGWQHLVRELHARGSHWRVWTDWYENIALHEPQRGITEAEDAAFTDIPGKLPWDDGADAVNKEIARRLAELRRAKSMEIPDQSPAPVRVEERAGQIAKANDRDSPLCASERDFKAWRDPVVDHIEELTTTEFAQGTNHSRIRDRLVAFGRLLPGEIEDVKERQFRVGYEIERFEGLMKAYRSGGDDMPVLNAAQLEDLDRLRIALGIGIDKLERWAEFRKQANQSTAGEAEADRAVVSDALDDMAATMEQRPRYFDPEVPATFRFLAEAVRDPAGATRTVLYGAIKSAENVVSFLAQKALGVGRKGAEAAERHISKAVATLLVAGLSSAALEISGALPHGWAWLKPLLAALGVGG